MKIIFIGDLIITICLLIGIFDLLYINAIQNENNEKGAILIFLGSLLTYFIVLIIDSIA